MLDQIAALNPNERVWDALTSRARLPCPPDEFFGLSGLPSASAHSRRQYHRFFLREMAVLAHGETVHAVYTKDMSRKGIAIFSPIQLFPCEQIKVLLLGQPALHLEVRRCRRILEDCYDCGSVFCGGLLTANAYKQLIRRCRKED